MSNRYVELKSTAIWTMSKLSILLFSYISLWILTELEAQDLQFKDKLVTFWDLSIWNQWDVTNYISIAEKGYSISELETNIAFFPGFPLVIKLFAYLPITFIQSAFIVTFVGGIFASIFLNKLAVKEGDVSYSTLIAWVLAPMSLFLFIPYSESLFCGFAFAAWYFAKQNKWFISGLLIFSASMIRVNGIFLTVAIIVMFLLNNRQNLSKILPLFLGFVPIVSFFTYLKFKFGSWTLWFEVQEKFWQRKFTNPIISFENTVSRASYLEYDSSWIMQNRIEIICIFIITIFLIYFFAIRAWPEFVYIFLTYFALITSTFWWTAPRTLLSLVPIWITLGVFLEKNVLVRNLYLIFTVPLFVLNVLSFMSGRSVN